MNYTLKINNKDITGFQLVRLNLSQEITFITSYNLSFNKVDFTIPFDFANILFDTTVLNNVGVFDSTGNQVFSGYPTSKKVNYSNKTIYMTATAYLNQLSKKTFTLADNGVQPAGAYMLSLFQNYYLPSLPVQYSVDTHIKNDNLLNGISLYKNSNNNTENGISAVNALCDLIDTAVYADNNKLTFSAFPEVWPDKQSVFDISNSLESPLTIQEKSEYYYDTVLLEYYNVPNGTKKTLTKGTGNLTKKVSPSGIFMDDTSAQNILDRKFNIVSKNYYTVEFKCDIQAIINLSDFFAYQGYIFLITYLQPAYTYYSVKAIGIKNTGA